MAGRNGWPPSENDPATPMMGPPTVKMVKTGFMGKISNLQLEVPYFDMIVQKCACEKSYISIIITFITQASLKYLQEPAAILGPQNRTQGHCAVYFALYFGNFTSLALKLILA